MANPAEYYVAASPPFVAAHVGGRAIMGRVRPLGCWLCSSLLECIEDRSVRESRRTLRHNSG